MPPHILDEGRLVIFTGKHRKKDDARFAFVPFVGVKSPLRLKRVDKIRIGQNKIKVKLPKFSPGRLHVKEKTGSISNDVSSSVAINSGTEIRICIGESSNMHISHGKGSETDQEMNQGVNYVHALENLGPIEWSSQFHSNCRMIQVQNLRWSCPALDQLDWVQAALTSCHVIPSNVKNMCLAVLDLCIFFVDKSNASIPHDWLNHEKHGLVGNFRGVSASMNLATISGGLNLWFQFVNFELDGASSSHAAALPWRSSFINHAPVNIAELVSAGTPTHASFVGVLAGGNRWYRKAMS
ncbi:hypothetical protein VNO78_23431 [Psophocarpus tetragonolobus]|uniref:Uncharacterized protein n=1 Tax=Psophocarpus tetragonolobus TaxID=3891 RepID=A0AAN9S347_PSOTE